MYRLNSSTWRILDYLAIAQDDSHCGVKSVEKGFIVDGLADGVLQCAMDDRDDFAEQVCRCAMPTPGVSRWGLLRS